VDFSIKDYLLRGIPASHPQKTFWPNIFVGGEIKILGILEYASGLNFASAAILSQNPFF
jgi:hypothetical protein